MTAPEQSNLQVRNVTSQTKKKTWRDSAPIDMFLSAVPVLVVVQLSSEVPEGLMNYPVYIYIYLFTVLCLFLPFCILPHEMK